MPLLALSPGLSLKLLGLLCRLLSLRLSLRLGRWGRLQLR